MQEGADGYLLKPCTITLYDKKSFWKWYDGWLEKVRCVDEK